jgi:hypothetical protein
MLKRGQVSIFIIVGVAILLLAGLILVFNSSTIKIKENPQILSQSSIQEFMQSCLERTSKQGITRITRQGGYYTPPNESSIVYFNDQIPYFYENKEYKIITAKVFEEQLGKYINENLPSCIGDLNQFRDEGYAFEIKNPQATITADKNILIDVKYPIEVRKDQSVANLDGFTYSIDLNIDNFLKSSKELVDLQVKNEGYICLTCLQEIDKRYGLNIDVQPIHDVSIYNNDIVWYRITDKNKEFIGEDELIFEFVTEYFNASAPEPDLEIEDITDITAKVGDEIDFKVQANRQAKYTSLTNLFKISEEGKINFIAKPEYIGSHLIYITAEDELEQETEEIFTITVE